MNREDYIAEVDRQLSNEIIMKNYLKTLMKVLRKAYTITFQKFKTNVHYKVFNFSCENRAPQFYILPMTHKTKNLGYPERPIVPVCGSLTENVSAFLDGILKPHMESLPSYIKGTTY